MIGSIAAAMGGFAFFALGISALIAPGISSAQYGLPATDRTALAFVRAVGMRDFVLGCIVVLLLARRDRSALGLVLSVSTLAAVGDALTVKSVRRDAGLQQFGVHIGGAAALLLAWQLVRSGR